MSADEHSVMSPDRDILRLHDLTGPDADLPSAGYHPFDHADPLGENDRTFGLHLPDLPRKDLVIQRKNESQSDRIRRMGVIHDPELRISRLDHFEIHQVGGKLARRPSAAGQSPHDLVFCPGLIDTDDRNIVREVQFHVPHVFPASGHHEILAGEIPDLGADLPPLRVFVPLILQLRHFLFSHTVGKISSVALMPSLGKSVGTEFGKILDHFAVQHFLNLSWKELRFRSAPPHRTTSWERPWTPDSNSIHRRKACSSSPRSS